MPGINVLSAAARSNVFAIQRSQNNISQITERLATGKRVNSALDNPQNFAASQSLTQKSARLERVLDNIVRSVLTLQQASSALEGIGNLLDQAQTVTNESRTSFLNNVDDPNSVLNSSGQSLQDLILGDTPVAYFRLDGDVSNSGTAGSALDGVLFNGGPALNGEALYNNQAGSSAVFNGNEGVRVPDSSLINTASSYPERTVELVFNADSVSGRQVLYEEGGATNAFAIYIDDGTLYATGRDTGTGGPFSASASIEAGQTYHAAFTFNFPDTARFEGFLNGQNIGGANVGRNFPAHGGDIGIGFSPDSAYYFDGPGTGRNYFDGRITDVAVYNDTLSQSDFQARTEALAATFLNETYETIISQIDQLSADADYLGTNLLAGDLLTTSFNPGGSSFLETDGLEVSRAGLGLLSGEYSDVQDIDDILDALQGAVDQIEDFARSFNVDLNILNTRGEYTNNSINTLESGADDLTRANSSRDSADLIAAQTQLLLAQETLSLTTRSNGANIFNVLQASESRFGFSV